MGIECGMKKRLPGLSVKVRYWLLLLFGGKEEKERRRRERRSEGR